MSADDSTTNVGQQVLQTAGFYPPLVYDLLTRFGSLITQPDSLSTDYLPLTDVLPPASSETLPFVVGFIAPPAPTGKLISREASVASNGGAPLPDTTLQTQPAVNNTGNSTTQGRSPPPTYNKFSAGQIAGLVSQVYAQTHNGQTPSPQLAWMLAAQSLRETGGNWPDNNPGFIQANDKNQRTFSVKGGGVDASGGKYSTWRSFDTPQEGTHTFINTALRTADERTAASNGDVEGYVAALGAAGYYGPYTDSSGVYHDATTAQQEYLNNFQALYDRVKNAAPDPSAVNLSNLPGGSANPVNGDVANNPGWQNSNGSSNAQAAAMGRDSTANKNLNTTTLGQQFQAQQQAQIDTLAYLTQQMASTPPLRMLVNPRSFKNSLEKVIADGNWGRNGPIIEHWGENLDKIEGSGKIAAFYSMDNSPPGLNSDGSAGAGPGLSRMTRNYSTSYQNLLALYLIYRSNAGIWTPDYMNAAKDASGTWAGQLNLSVLGSIYIYYDNILYVGCFDSFNITESDEAPFSLEYTFAFTVRAWFTLDQQQDPRLGWQKPVNGPPAGQPGIQPQNGQVPTQNAISQFGPSAGQPAPGAGLTSEQAAAGLGFKVPITSETVSGTPGEIAQAIIP